MLSIIIPVFNQHEMTGDCILALRETTGDYEIILVDNGSNPPFKLPYTGFAETTLIRNEENQGFPAAVNQGIQAAKGDVIVLLNNDVILTPGWVDRLLADLDTFSIVGPVTNYCAGKQRVTVGTYENRDELAKAAEAWAESEGDQVEEVRWVIGFCMAFPKTLVDQIGPFDESLWPCCGEEIDFCLRARAAGHRIGIVRGCYVHHEGSVTFRAIEAEHPYQDIIVRNEKHLEAKWGKEWHRQALDASPAPAGLCLNLGCGYRRLQGFINIDNRPEVKPDQLLDVRSGLPYETGSVDMVRADDFLEHIPIGQVVPVIEEIWRILKPGGIFESSTPSTDGRGAFQDPTHVSFWNRNSWLYYSDPASRDLYGIRADFEIESLKDKETSPELGIIHTHVIARARK